MKIRIKWTVTQKMTGRIVETGARLMRILNMDVPAKDHVRRTIAFLSESWPRCAYEITANWTPLVSE